MLARKKKPTLAGERPPSDRKPSGDRKQGIAPTTFFRIREHGVRLGADPRLATVLGRMGLFNELSPAEVDAGFRVAEIYGAYEAMAGMPRRSAPSPSYQRGFGAGEIDTSRMTPDELKRFQRRQRRAQKVYDRLISWIPISAEVRLVEIACCDNEEVGPLNKSRLAAILHDLAIKFGFAHDQVAKPSRSPSVEDDGSQIAVAAIDALFSWFEERGSKPTHFSLVDNRDWKKVRGITASDSRYHHTVPVPLRNLTAKALEGQLRLACAVRGLLEINDASTGEVA